MAGLSGSPAPAAEARGPFWRALKVIVGVALFLYALRLLAPMPIERGPFVLLAALLAAGAMALADSAIGLVANVLANLRKGPKP